MRCQGRLLHLILSFLPSDRHKYHTRSILPWRGAQSDYFSKWDNRQFYFFSMRRQLKGEFVLVHPQIHFRHKHLSLEKQRKDKDIKKQREELEGKRREFEDTRAKWAKEEAEFRLYSAKRRDENLQLIRQDQQLKDELFRLAIRRDQIQSRSDPSITLRKASIIKAYLKCVSYTAGKKLELITFWKSEWRYNHLKFLLELAVDRYFGRSHIQKSIIGNLSRIVFCKKVKFEGQSIMVCIKEPEESSSHYCNKTSKKSPRSIYHPQYTPRNRILELQVYAITGKYFHITRLFNEEQLRQWAEAASQALLRLNKSPLVEPTAQSKPVINHHRLSVADNIAKSNALKEFSETLKMVLNNPPRESIVLPQEGFKVISEEVVPSSQNSQLNEDIDEDSTVQQFSPMEKKSSNDENESSRDPTEENLLDASESDGEMQNVKLKTRKSMHSKSSFYINGKIQSNVCKFNRQFLSGAEEILFPQANPIENMIILKDKRAVYFLQEYVECSRKKLILDKAVARFRLKMKIKAEQKRCLLHRIVTITQCYETLMGEEESISLPCLIVLKSHQTADAYQIHISCDSLITHSKIQNGLQIKALLHQTLKQREESKEIKISSRSSNIKNIKNGGQRKSRESKRRQNARNLSKKLSIDPHQKSNFGTAKKNCEHWVPFSGDVIEKYQRFMDAHIISIQRKQFITKQWVRNRILGIIRIQNKIRSIISKRRYKAAKQVSKCRCAWRPAIRVLITAMLSIKEKKVRVYFEKVEMGSMELAKAVDYEDQHWDAVCNSLQSTQHEGSFEEVCSHLINTIKVNIEIETEKRVQFERQKPEKYRKMIRTFFFMISLRNRAKRNIFFIKRITIKDRIFVLLIRRDHHLKSLLICNLYDIIQKPKDDPKEIKNSETAFSKQEKEVGSEYGSHKPGSRSKPELDDKICKYQKIYLMEQYFQQIESSRIVDQFYIEKGVFLLKPPKAFNLYYIERLATLDLNSEQFSKEFGYYERDENMLKMNEDRLSQNVSNKSLKRMLNQNTSDKTEKNQTQSRQLLNISKMKGRKESKENSKKQKKTSIEKNEREIITFLKSNFMRQNLHNVQMLSKKSFGQSNSGKARQIYQIKNNSHESTVYYSLYKSENVFFYLEFFIVQKTRYKNTYHEELQSIDKCRLYKKQLEQANLSLFYKKLAGWAHENEDQFIRTHDASKDKNEDNFKKDDSVSNFVTLEFFNALIGGNKRFSYDLQSSVIAEKGPRTNTLTL